jgi:hypothetical protein
MKASSGASSAAAAIFQPLYAPISCRRPEGTGRAASRLHGSSDVIYLRLRAVALFDRRGVLDRDCDVRFVREAVERPGLLRRVERAVLRDGLRRFVAVLRVAVDLRVVDLRAVDLRPGDFRDVELRADDLGADDLRVVRLAVLRALVLPPDALPPDALRPDVLRPEDAAVLPARSRRFVRARLRLFFAGLS